MIAPEAAPMPAPRSVGVQLAIDRPIKANATIFFIKIFS
jgi:hypothetical protein